MPKDSEKRLGSRIVRRYGRRFDTLQPRKKYLIVTEGKTEAIYFEHYRTSTGPDVIVVDGADNKRSLVEQANAEKIRLVTTGRFDEEIDEAWVVLDRDEQRSNPRDKTLFNEALQVASNNGLNVAYSNDSFELWLLLHFQDLDTPTHRSDIERKLSQAIGRRYAKDGSCDLYDEIRDARPHAIKRAKKIMKNSGKIPPLDANPTTTIHLLVEKLISEDGFRER